MAQKSMKPLIIDLKFNLGQQSECLSLATVPDFPRVWWGGRNFWFYSVRLLPFYIYL